MEPVIEVWCIGYKKYGNRIVWTSVFNGSKNFRQDSKMALNKYHVSKAAKLTKSKLKLYGEKNSILLKYLSENIRNYSHAGVLKLYTSIF